MNAKLKEIEKLPGRRHRPRWCNIYGAPLVVPTITEMAEAVKKVAPKKVRLGSV